VVPQTKFIVKQDNPFKDMISSDIPCSQYNPNDCDLLLIDGNLCDPNEDSKVVLETLKLINEYISSQMQPTQILIGPSGCGKTKACFDILKKQFGVYLDFSGQGIKDVEELRKQIKELCSKFSKTINKTRTIDEQKNFESCSIRLVHLLLISRLLAFFYLYEKKNTQNPKRMVIITIKWSTRFIL